jgi:putrescine aminotransferase
MDHSGDDQFLDSVVDKYAKYVNPGLARLMAFAGYGVEAKAEGCYLYDHTGKKFLDCLGGYGVFGIGHRHPKVVEAAKRALDTQPLPSKVFFSRPLADLAEKLAQISPGELQYSFFCNSGTEAVEGALKLAKAFTGREKFVATHAGYHGKTMGALSATGREKYREPFLPLVPGFGFAPFNDVGALSAIDDQTAAFIVETIQGEGGIHVATAEYMAAARKACDRVGALLIVDEVQTGFGRTGKMFGLDHHPGVQADLVTYAKGLSGGVAPVGAFMGTERIWAKVFGENPLVHTSTFGGNALACEVALASITVVEEERLCDRAASMGLKMKAGLQSVRDRFPELISDVRGEGLMLGVEFTMDDVGELCIAQMVKRGVVAAYTLNNRRVIRFEPPLIITESEVDTAISVFGESVEETNSLVSAVMQ